MNHLTTIVQSYLVNSLWQVPLLFGVAWMLAHFSSILGPRLQHRVWVGALLLQCLLPACHLPAGWRTGLLARFGTAGANGANVSVEVGPGLVGGGLHVWPGLVGLCTAAYILAIAFFATRLAWRYWRASLLQSVALPLALPPREAAVFTQFCERLDLPQVPVTCSSGIFGPSTVGMVRRVVVLPCSLVADADPQDLHAALAHELAHVQRRDFAKNLLYELAALAVAYHPCCWLTRARLTESREIVCDEIAADLLTGSNGRQVYARSLLRLAAQLTAMPRAHNRHAIGMFDSNSFERRIMQLSTQVQIVRGVRRRLMLGALGAVALVTCGSALALGSNSPEAMVTPGPQAPKGQPPVAVSPGVMAGQVLHKVTPVYPPEAKEAKISGVVVLHAIIGRDGTVQSLQVKSGPPELVQSAIDSVKQWTYKPFLLNGQPTEVDTNITVNYSFSQ